MFCSIITVIGCGVKICFPSPRHWLGGTANERATEQSEEWMWKYAITAVQRDCWLWNTLWSSIDSSVDSLFVANIVTACDIRTSTRVSAHQAHSIQSTIPHIHCAYNNRKRCKTSGARDNEQNAILARRIFSHTSKTSKWMCLVRRLIK